MNALKQAAAKKVRKQVSRQESSFPNQKLEEKNFPNRQKICQLQEKVKQLIDLSCLSKGEIASALGVTPSTISRWLDESGENRRKVHMKQAQQVLKLVKSRPRLILGALEEVEAAIDQEISNQYGPSARRADGD